MRRILSLPIGCVVTAATLAVIPRVEAAESIRVNDADPTHAGQGETSRRILPQGDPAIGPMIAKRTKKKRAKKVEEDTSGSDSGSGSALHAQQDGGNPEAPYKWEASLLSDFARKTSTTAGVSSGSGTYDLDALGLYVISSLIEVGPRVTYHESTAKLGEASITDRAYGLAGVAKINFGDINRDEHLFFAKLFFGFGSDTSKTGDADAAKTSSTQYGLGLGFHYFVDSNVALTAEVSYEGGSEKPAEGEATSVSTIHLMKIGFSLFL